MAGFRVVIPARYGSKRFPGKVLTSIAGLSMLERVWTAAVRSGADEVIIAADDERVVAEGERLNAHVVRTASDHQSGTDRVNEVASRMGWDDADIVVNLQGDEPLMPPMLITQVAGALAQREEASIATACAAISNEEDWRNTNVVKVVRDRYGNALYFSRAQIPFGRDRSPSEQTWALLRRHIGIYAYRIGALHRFSGYGPCALEKCEALEQLRAQWHAMKIHVVDVDVVPGPGVDTPEDVSLVEKYLQGATS